MTAPLAARLALLAGPATSTVTTFAPGGPSLAKSDPSNGIGLLVGIITTLVVAVGALLLYLRHRRTT
ncbi:MAG TPA: hypothetical protein VMT43_12150 [Acidimicrobiales bacterium]|nr:hypothetical protein [Acidimicrobiales bacterium]